MRWRNRRWHCNPAQYSRAQCSRCKQQCAVTTHNARCNHPEPQVGNPICRQIPWGEGRQYDERLQVRLVTKGAVGTGWQGIMA